MNAMNETCELLFVDIETGGLEQDIHAITEIAFIITDIRAYNIYTKINMKVKTSGLITEEAAALNGYNPEKWYNAIDFKNFMNIFNQSTEGLPKQWIGSNPLFDYNFIKYHCNKEKIKFEPNLVSHHLLDVGSMFWEYVVRGNLNSVDQSSLSKHYLKEEHVHTAGNDVEQCRKLYKHLIALK